MEKTYGMLLAKSKSFPGRGIWLANGWSHCRGVSMRPGLIHLQPFFEDFNGGEEVVALGDEQVDIVEVFVAFEAVGEVVVGIHCGARNCSRNFTELRQ